MKNVIEGYIEVQGVKIHYLTNSVHDPKKMTLLFVPGIMMPAWIWEKQLDYFAQVYNVIAFDPRSQGDSEQSSEGQDAFSMAQDIDAVVQALELEPFVLIGWSLGVPQVINYAAHFGSKGLVGLVLVDGIAGIDSSLPFYQGMVDYWSQFQLDRTSNTPKFIRSMFKQPQSEDYLDKLNEVAMRMPTKTVMTLINNYIHQDFRSLLPAMRVPTFIATIEGPRLDYMKTIQKMIPNAQMEVFQSAGHALFVDQPDRFNHFLEIFIQKLSIPAQST